MNKPYNANTNEGETARCVTVDSGGRVTGTDTVANAIAHGKIRLVVRVVLVSSNNKMLVQQRASRMRLDPDCWDVATAGHVDPGETPVMAAQRELYEEVGLKIDAGLFHEVGSRFSNRFFEHLGHTSPMFAHYFAVRVAEKMVGTELKTQASEVADAKWIDIDGFLKLGSIVPDALAAYTFAIESNA